MSNDKMSKPKMLEKESEMSVHYDPDGVALRMYTVRPPAHPLLVGDVPSAVLPHIAALQEAGVYDVLTEAQQAVIIRLMQRAYGMGRVDCGAEKLDYDCVWVDGVGLLECRSGSSWVVVGEGRDED